MMETTAGLIGRSPAPATVDGLDYAAIRDLGALEGSCESLRQAHDSERYVSQRTLNDLWLPACRQRIVEARRFNEEMERLVRQAYEAEQAHQKALAEQREKERRVREAMEAARRDAEERQRASAEEENREHLSERLADAHILQILDDIPDQPLAFSLGQPSERSMKNFLACLEVGYPNQGYQVQRGDDALTVTALQADMLRGDVDIRARFVNVWDTWMLESLSVAEMTADTPRDRFMLAQNLMAGPCYGIDELLRRPAADDDGQSG
ncbi:hypothetical protein ACLD02_10295 [Alloalcanivorax sp. C16-2]|uniref:hypothetical protein n=1 Tax=Alloalcanivorax TaxID=3020832 RepID=UPI001933F7E2|nr:hypothetical protein [Alloalcanivorax marinus]MBL7249209.1 hypothetical protein [Alloalcanivorax marinus]